MNQASLDFNEASETKPLPALQLMLHRLAPLQPDDKALFQSVWRVLHDNDVWSIAITQHFMLVVRGALPEALPLETELAGAAYLVKMLERFRGFDNWCSVDAAQLRKFCGAAQFPVRCSSCDDQFRQICPECNAVELSCEYCQSCGSVTCEWCKGEGFSFPEPRVGWIAGYPLNLNFVAVILATMGDEGAKLREIAVEKPLDGKRSPALFLDGGNWGAIVMGLKPHVLWNDAPRFEVKS